MAEKFQLTIDLEGADFEGDFEASWEVAVMLHKLADRVEDERGTYSGDYLATLDGIKVYSTSGVGAGKVVVT